MARWTASIIDDRSRPMIHVAMWREGVRDRRDHLNGSPPRRLSTCWVSGVPGRLLYMSTCTITKPEVRLAFTFWHICRISTARPCSDKQRLTRRRRTGGKKQQDHEKTCAFCSRVQISAHKRTKTLLKCRRRVRAGVWCCCSSRRPAEQVRFVSMLAPGRRSGLELRPFARSGAQGLHWE